MRSYSQDLPVRPTCVIGCGGRGCEVVCEAMEYLAGDITEPEDSDERHGLFTKIPPFWVPLGIDAFRDPREHRGLAAGRFFDLDPGNLSAMIDRVEAGEEPHIAKWLEWQVAMATLSGWGMEGRRQLGRLAYDLRRRDIRGWLDRIYKDDLTIADLDARVQAWQTDQDVSPRYVVDARQQVEVVLVSSLCGGTGSSILLPLAADIRDTFGSVSLTAVLFLPESFGINDAETRSMIEANAYACLKEIDHFMREGDYRTQYRDVDEIYQRRPLFDCVYLVSATRRHDTVNVPVLLKGVAKYVASLATRPGGFGIVSRYVNYRDLRQSTLDQYGKRRCYSFLGSSERVLKVEELMQNLTPMIYEDVLDAIGGQTAETGGAGGYSRSLGDAIEAATVNVDGMRCSPSHEIFDRATIPDRPKAGLASNLIADARREVTGDNDTTLEAEKKRADEYLKGTVTDAIRTHLETTVADRGIGAGLVEIDGARAWAQQWQEGHQACERLASERSDRLADEANTLRQQLVKTRDSGEALARAERLCRMLTDVETARMAVAYHHVIVESLGDLLRQLERWHSALASHAETIRAVLRERSRFKAGHSSSTSVAVAFRAHLLEDAPGLWGTARKKVSRLLFQTGGDQDLVQGMRDACRAVLDGQRTELTPGKIIMRHDGTPSHFLNSAIEEAEPCWSPAPVALQDSPPVQLMSMEVNGKELPDLAVLARALQVGAGRDVEARQGFLNNRSFLLLRAEVGASVTYLPQIADWYRAYKRMLEVLQEGRRTGRAQGRQPHTEKRYEFECEELVTLVEDTDVLAFGLGITARLFTRDMGSWRYARDGTQYDMGRDYREALEYCVRHRLVGGIGERGDEFLRTRVDNDRARADLLQREASELREAMARAKTLDEGEKELHLRLAAELERHAETFREGS